MENLIEPFTRIFHPAIAGFLAAAILAVGPLMAAPMTALNLELDPWRAINDGVMGGISLGEMVATDDGLRFRGTLSLENNGGFASVRRTVDARLEGIGGVRLRVRGDGRPYQFRLRLDDNYDGIAWRQTFDTDGSWQTVDLSLDEFRPVFRGRIVAGAAPLDPARIRQLGFLLADKKAGPFRLDIAAIEFLYR